MKLVRTLCFCLLASSAAAFEIDELFDRLDAALTVAAFQDNFRARLSGTIDLEFYNFEQPAPGLIDSSSDNLFNPRLTLFLDAQIGSQIYFFTQARLDRGFDPSDEGAQIRLDEYALRITPWADGRPDCESLSAARWRCTRCCRTGSYNPGPLASCHWSFRG